MLALDGHAVMIDTGEEDDAEEIVSLMASRDIDVLDYLILTHFDKDHIGGVSAVLESVSVKQIYFPRYEKDSKLYRAMMASIEKSGAPYAFLTEDTQCQAGNLAFKISVPKAEQSESNDNEHSLVIRASYGEKRFLFTGDAEAERLGELLSEGDLACDVLKMPHHGRYNDRTEDFLKACAPKSVLITDSDKSPADSDVLNLIAQYGATAYETRSGDIRVVTNGSLLAVHQD